MKRLLSVISLLGLALSLWAGQAAASIVYQFSGVTFDNGGTLTGTFTSNDAMTGLLDFDITTSAASAIGFHYTSATAASTSTSLPFILVLSTPSLDNILEVTFSNLTAAGSPITIDHFGSFEQTLGARRDILGGSVTAVPEPATYALMLAGLMLVAGIARKRQN